MLIAMAHVLEEYTAATEHGWYGESTHHFSGMMTNWFRVAVNLSLYRQRQQILLYFPECHTYNFTHPDVECIWFLLHCHFHGLFLSEDQRVAQQWLSVFVSMFETALHLTFIQWQLRGLRLTSWPAGVAYFSQGGLALFGVPTSWPHLDGGRLVFFVVANHVIILYVSTIQRGLYVAHI